MSHAPPFGCNEYPPGGARPDEEAFVSTEQQSPKHTIFLQRNSKVGVELSMAIVIEGYVNIAGKRSNFRLIPECQDVFMKLSCLMRSKRHCFRRPA